MKYDVYTLEEMKEGTSRQVGEKLSVTQISE